MSDLSVSIVSFNTRELLHACLDAVDSERSKIDIDVTVVDNASVDGSADAAGRFPRVDS